MVDEEGGGLQAARAGMTHPVVDLLQEGEEDLGRKAGKEGGGGSIPYFLE